MAGFGIVDMETLICRVAAGFQHTELECCSYRGFEPDLITRVGDLVMVSDTASLEPGPSHCERRSIYIPPGRHPVYVGFPGCTGHGHINSLLFVPLAEPDRIADAQWHKGQQSDFPLPEHDYLLLCDEQALRLPGASVQNSAINIFIRGVEANDVARHDTASTWPRHVLDDESGMNVLALPITERLLSDYYGAGGEELLAVMILGDG